MKSKNVPPIVISTPPQHTTKQYTTSSSSHYHKSSAQLETSGENFNYGTKPHPNNYTPNYNFKNKAKKQTSYFPSETDLINSQEYLIDEKWHLLEDIEQLRYEIGPMNLEIQNLNLYINKSQDKLANKQHRSYKKMPQKNKLNSSNEESDFQMENRITKLEAEYNNLTKEYKKISEKYGQETLENTKTFVDIQYDQIQQLTENIEESENILVNLENEFKNENLLKAEESSQKMNEDIKDLKKQMKDLKKEENELNNYIIQIYNDGKNNNKNTELEKLNKELTALRQISSKKQHEFNANKKTHEIKTSKLRQTISKRSELEKEANERKKFYDKMHKNQQRDDESSQKENSGFIFDTYMKSNKKKKIWQADEQDKFDDGESSFDEVNLQLEVSGITGEILPDRNDELEEEEEEEAEPHVLNVQISGIVGSILPNEEEENENDDKFVDNT